MAELLTRKKRMCARHRSSAMKTIGQAYEALEDAETNLSKLKQRAALEEKIELLQHLDELTRLPRKTISLKK